MKVGSLWHYDGGPQEPMNYETGIEPALEKLGVKKQMRVSLADNDISSKLISFPDFLIFQV